MNKQIRNAIIDKNNGLFSTATELFALHEKQDFKRERLVQKLIEKGSTYKEYLKKNEIEPAGAIACPMGEFAKIVFEMHDARGNGARLNAKVTDLVALADKKLDEDTKITIMYGMISFPTDLLTPAEIKERDAFIASRPKSEQEYLRELISYRPSK